MPAHGFLAVGAGAVLGAWLRWGMGAAFNAVLPTLPLGTLAANLVGSYLIGVCIELFVSHPSLTPEFRLFAVTGFLGALTTFSTFSAEAFTLLSRQQYGWASLHIITHLAGSILMTGLGIVTVKAFAR